MMRPILLFLVFCLVSTSSLAEKTLRLTLPDYKGCFEVRIDEALKVRESQFREDGSGIRLASDGLQGIYITIFVQKADGPPSPVEARKLWWANKTLEGEKRGKVEMSEGPGSARLEYLNESYLGLPVRQRNLHQYFAGGGIWVEVHMSKASWMPVDQKLFDDLLTHFKLDPDYKPTSTDLWIYGSALYVSHKYLGAAKIYQRALDLDQQQPTLTPIAWHVLVDNLGMAYGMTHDLTNAKQVFEYGVSKDDKYPMFYYNLACVSGEQNDLDGTLKNLKLAFDRRANILPGESMPNPMKDDSFRHFIKDKRFQEAVADLPKK